MSTQSKAAKDAVDRRASMTEEANRELSRFNDELSNENDNVYIFSVDVGDALECALLLEFDGFLFPVSNDAYELVSCVIDQVPN